MHGSVQRLVSLLRCSAPDGAEPLSFPRPSALRQRLLGKQRRCAGSGAALPPSPVLHSPPFLSPSNPQGNALGGPRAPPGPALPSPLPSALPLPAVSGSMSELPPPGPGPASRRGGCPIGPPQPRALPEVPAPPAARPSPPAAGAPGAAQPHGDGPEGRRGALAEQKKGNGALPGGGLGGAGGRSCGAAEGQLLRPTGSP